MKDVDFKKALQDLMNFLIDSKITTKNAMKVDILDQVSQWINAQPGYIKVLLGEFKCEN